MVSQFTLVFGEQMTRPLAVAPANTSGTKPPAENQGGGGGLPSSGSSRVLQGTVRMNVMVI